MKLLPSVLIRYFIVNPDVAKLKMDLQESNNNQMSDANMVESHNNNEDVGGVIVDDLRTGGHLGALDLEPRDGIAFDTHEAAYTFYQDYAKSMGFTTSIKNSRRSKKTKDFIDAKFACSRYGSTPESESGSSSGRRSSVKKTDCKASMHVKRKSDGRWIIHEFIKEHNHELLPALAYHFRIQRNIKLAEKNNIDILHAVSERTRKIEEGCVSEENYNIVLRTLVETLKNCVDLNHARNNFAESNSQLNNGAHEEENHVLAAVKATKKKTVVRKRKGQPEASQMLESQPSLQPMENISSEGMSMSGYYGPQQNVQGLLNLMEPPHEGYYVNQRTIQGLGQLNSIAPVQDSFFTNQQAMPGLGQMDFRPPPNFAYNLQDEHLRSAQLPGSSSRQL
ncbi:hypothetical protein HID58_070765 [Brassica napus]|uniref:FAR1 domain-containing protein n=1 Tax=Brassica napus TaxID=3708 RepID=A0ABQ7YZT4_BRANA|nr:hypothetical protein HID58_070765 [Brassica napus]